MPHPTPLDAILSRHGHTRRSFSDAMQIHIAKVNDWATGKARLLARDCASIEEKLGIPRVELRLRSPLDGVLGEYGLTRTDAANVLGVTVSAIGTYCVAGRLIPAESAVRLEQAVGIPRHRLRPDLWPEPVPMAVALALPKPKVLRVPVGAKLRIGKLQRKSRTGPPGSPETG
jgi:DNA-binding transcriptional regulator YdaS (Cro superfamily)